MVPCTQINDGGRARGFSGRRLVDHDHFADVLDAGEFLDRAGVRLDRFAALAQEVAVEQSVDERGFARAGDSGHAREDTERKVGVQFADVVQGGTAEFEEFFRFAAFRRHGDGSPPEKVIGGQRVLGVSHAVRRAAEHQAPAGLAAAGPDVGEPVRGADDRFLVLDDDEGVPVVAQAPHDAQKLPEVALVQPHAGFVHDEQRVDQRGAEAGGQVDALDFAARERACRPVQREVAEPDFGEIREARAYLVEEKLRGVVAVGDGHAGEEIAEPADRAGGDPGEGEGFAGCAVETVVERFRLVASAVARRAFVVAAVAAEQHADVHFVGLGFEPVEIPLHAIPTVVVPDLVQGFAGLAVAIDDPIAVGPGQFLERAMQVDLPAASVADQVGLAFLRHTALERAHHALGESARAVRNDAVPIEPDHASEAPAFGAGAERMVETEQPRCGRPYVDIAPRAVPARGERTGFTGGGIDQHDASFSEAECGFDRLGHACFVRGIHSVLDDMDDGRELGGRLFVGAEGFPVEPDAEVTLLLEEFEKLRGCALFDVTRADGEGDEQGAPRVPCGRFLHDASGRLRPDRAVAIRARCSGEPGQQEFQVVIDLGDRPDGRACGFDIVRLLDGDGRGDALDGVDARFVHAVEELPRVGRECLDVAPLALRVDRVERERRFAGTAGTGDDVQASARQVEVDPLQVVLTRAADTQDGGSRRRGLGSGAFAGGHAREAGNVSAATRQDRARCVSSNAPNAPAREKLR